MSDQQLLVVGREETEDEANDKRLSDVGMKLFEAGFYHSSMHMQTNKAISGAILPASSSPLHFDVGFSVTKKSLENFLALVYSGNASPRFDLSGPNQALVSIARALLCLFAKQATVIAHSPIHCDLLELCSNVCCTLTSSSSTVGLTVTKKTLQNFFDALVYSGNASPSFDLALFSVAQALLCVFYKQVCTNMKGANGNAAYVDTAAIFPVDHLASIAKMFGMDPGAVLDNVRLPSTRASTNEHSFLRLPQFRVDYTGTEELAIRQKLAQSLIKMPTYKGGTCSMIRCGMSGMSVKELANVPPLLSTQTAIIALHISGHLFLGCESLITPGYNPPFDKVIWLTNDIAIGTAGKCGLINMFRTTLVEHLKLVWSQISDMDCLANEVKRFMELSIDPKKAPYHLKYYLSFTLLGYFQDSKGVYTKGIYQITRTGDRSFVISKSDYGFFDGSGTVPMRKYAKLNPIDFAKQGAQLVDYGKHWVYKYIQEATVAVESRDTCGGFIQVIHIPPPNSGTRTTHHILKKDAAGRYNGVFGGVFPITLP